MPRPLLRSSPRSAAALPEVLPGLEDVHPADPRDAAAALAFALWRAAGRADDPRPVLLAAPAAWTAERGRLSAWGAAGLGLPFGRLILVRVRRPDEAVWALEEALKSGAAAGAVGACAAPAFVATRRLDFAARAGGACAVLLGPDAAGLSAARRRWRAAAAPSAPCPLDPRAPGAARLRAELIRRRDGPPAAFDLEHDHETGGFRLAAGLADHGAVPVRRTAA